MKILRPALITMLAVCLAAGGAVARTAKTMTHSRSSSASAKRKNSSSHNGKTAKHHNAAGHGTLGEHFDGYFDIPPEELPVPEDEAPPNQ